MSTQNYESGSRLRIVKVVPDAPKLVKQFFIQCQEGIVTTEQKIFEGEDGAVQMPLDFKLSVQNIDGITMVPSNRLYVIAIETAGEYEFIGSFSLSHETSDTACFGSFFIEEDHRRKGYGRKIINAVKKYAKYDLGYRYLKLSYMENSPVETLYLSTGFVSYKSQLLCDLATE